MYQQVINDAQDAAKLTAIDVTTTNGTRYRSDGFLFRTSALVSHWRPRKSGSRSAIL